MEQDYWVLLADVVGSRGIEDRTSFAERFKKAIEVANEQFGEDLLMQIQTWKGLDELAAVVKLPACLYRLSDLLNHLLAPRQIRMAVVAGPIDLLPENKDVRSADGPAFHRAAALMTELKREGLLFAATGPDKRTDQQLKVSINSLLLLKEGWTQNQRNLYAAYRQLGSQELVAQRNAVTQQSVSKTLKAIKARQVQLLEDSLQQWLNDQYR